MEDAAPQVERESMAFDIAIVGAGPAGLACAIRARQLAAEIGQDITVCVLEKGATVGAHLLSGAVLEPRALAELLPDYKERGAPLQDAVTEDRFLWLSAAKSLRLPTPPQMHNEGNYIVSLGELGAWLATEAEALGVEIFPGFAAARLLTDEAGAVIGVGTGDMGIGKDGLPGPNFTPGVDILTRQLVVAEGCRGSLSRQLMERFDLRRDCDPQTYGIGLKEIWEVPAAQHKPGQVTHTIGWPLDNRTYGGSFVYHYGERLVALGLVVGLDYENPHLDPYKEMQRFKLHPAIRSMLEGGRRISYGARAISEGGFQSLPKLTFPGGVLVGDAAGFLNTPKIKGQHTAMKSGMLAAEAIIAHLAAGGETAAAEVPDFQSRLEASWLWEELRRVRNIRPGFHRGLLAGLANGALETALGGRSPWTLHNRADHSALKPAADMPRIDYPKPDGVLTFDRLTSVQLTNTAHEEDQPAHLTLKDASVPVAINLAQFDAPEERYCPAAVYEIVGRGTDSPRLQINAQNCIHCKTCDIKDPTQNIVWVPPEGGGGPNYAGM